jgi:hypothetical protein
MQFWSVNVDPKYLNFATFSKDLLAALIYNYSALQSGLLSDMNQNGNVSTSFSETTLSGSQFCVDGQGEAYRRIFPIFRLEHPQKLSFMF